MLRFAISLRFVMLIASVGAAVGALLMFFEGTAKLVGGGLAIIAGQGAHSTIPQVMGGVDAFLFGMVLVIFAYAIAFGFVFDLTEEERARLPPWMQVNGVGELKDTLVSVILVYLVVDFATDWPEVEADPTWQSLAKPISIFLIAAAFRLFSSAGSHGHHHGKS